MANAIQSQDPKTSNLSFAIVHWDERRCPLLWKSAPSHAGQSSAVWQTQPPLWVLWADLIDSCSLHLPHAGRPISSLWCWWPRSTKLDTSSKTTRHCLHASDHASLSLVFVMKYTRDKVQLPKICQMILTLWFSQSCFKLSASSHSIMHHKMACNAVPFYQGRSVFSPFLSIFSLNFI